MSASAGIALALVLHVGAFALMFVGPRGPWLAYLAVSMGLVVAWALSGAVAGALSRAGLGSMLEAFTMAGLCAAGALLVARAIAGWLSPDDALTVMSAAIFLTAAVASFVAAFRCIKYAG